MNLEQRIAEDLKDALRAGDENRKRTLRMVRAALKNAAIEARGELDDEAVLAVLQRQARQRRESISAFERGGRADLVAAEKAELAVIEPYLPRQLTPEEIEAAARRQIEALGASGPQDLGRVMRPLIEEMSGRADGRVVSEIVRRLLNG